MAYPVKDRYIPNKGTAGNSSWVEGDYVTAANMNHIEDGIDQMVQAAENYADGAVDTVKGLSGSTVPTSATVGTVGQKYLYTNGTTKIIYECVDASNPYVWEMIYRYNTTDSKWYRTDTDGDEIDISSLIDEFEGDIESVVKDIEDGTIEAGRAVATKSIENVSEDSGITQDEPFVIQGTGTANGTASVDTSPVAKQLEKQGNSVVVNQLVQNPNFVDTTGWVGNPSYGTTVVSNNTLKYTLTVKNNSASVYTPNAYTSQGVQGHKYLFLVTVKCSANTTIYVDSGKYGLYTTNIGSLVANSKTTFIKIFTSGTIISGGLYIYTGLTSALEVGEIFELYNVYVIDLTQWFNGNIPQDILDNPNRFFNYYGGSLAYNAGTLTNGTGRYLVNTHRNLWDEVWELGSIDATTGQNVSGSSSIRSKNYVSVLPNVTYYFKIDGGYVRTFFYDANKNYISYKDDFRGLFEIPTNCYYIRFRTSGYGTTYANNITISLYYSPDEGGADYDKYFPYEEPSVYETGTEVLRSIGDIRDIKKPDGTITRYVGAADLGTANWDVVSNYAYIFLSDRKAGSDIKYILSKPMPSPITNFAFNAGNSGVVVSYPSGSFTTRAQLQQALNGIVLYYELATPTTEQGTTFAENIQIDDYGTMAWLSTYDAENPNNNVFTGVPQACKIFYPADMVLFLDSLGQRTDINWGANNIVSQEQLDEFETGARVAAKALLADNLESDDKIEDLSVYTMRQSPTGVSNGMILDHITGATVAYNQRIQNGNFINTNNWGAIGGSGGTLSASGNVLTLTLSGSGTNGILQSLTGKVANHKYLVMYDIKTSFAGKVRCLWTGGADEWVSPSTSIDTNANQWYHFAYIKNIGQTTTSGGSIYFYCYNSAVTSGTAQYRNIMMIDLTQMFGSTIANYLYNQGDTAGVNKFRILFPKPYYPYNAGELVSVKTAGRKTIGINQLVTQPVIDSSIQSLNTNTFTKLLPNQAYRYDISITNATSWRYIISAYDLNGNKLTVNDFTFSPTSFYVDAYGALINNGNISDQYLNITPKVECYICVNFSYGDTSSSTILSDASLHFSDASINGTYYPYEPNEYPCEQIELNGLYVLDSNNNLIADGDEYKYDGTVTRRYGKKELSELDFRSSTYGGVNYFRAKADPAYTSNNDAKVFGTCSIYQEDIGSGLPANGKIIYNSSYVGEGWTIIIRDDSVSTTAGLVAKLTDKGQIVFIKKVAEETSAASFASTQKTGITEQFMEPTVQNSVFLPVGHDSLYLPDLKNKLEIAPDSPTTDGVYLVSRSSGTNVYVPIADVTATQSEIDEIIEVLQ